LNAFGDGFTRYYGFDIGQSFFECGDDRRRRFALRRYWLWRTINPFIS
jgi:hypothetical protein